MERCVAGALRVVFMGDRRAEDRHDPVAGELIDGALETVNTLGEDREETVQDLVPLFRIDLLGEIHRALDVGEKDGDLLPLAFEGATGGENLFG
jgi:hypothetical protein